LRLFVAQEEAGNRGWRRGRRRRRGGGEVLRNQARGSGDMRTPVFDTGGQGREVEGRWGAGGWGE